MATEHLTTGPSKWRIDTALYILENHLDQLNCLALVLENRLADLCEKDDKDSYKNDSPPLIEWRMSQVMRDMLSSLEVRNNIEAHLCPEVAHG